MLFTVLCLSPLILLQALGNMRTKTLIWWSAIGTTLIATLTFYNTWRMLEPLPIFATANIFQWVFFLIIILFILHALILGGDSDRRFMDKYTTHFDVAWKSRLKLALASLFLCAFWALLLMGAGIFHLINISYFSDLIRERWFYIPASTTAIAVSIVITDVKPKLIRGFRTLILILLSSLLPLLSGITSIFLLTLFITGPQPLWEQNFLMPPLMSTIIFLIVLINTAALLWL